MNPTPEYACSLKGIGLFCLSQWEWFRNQKIGTMDDEMIRTGRMAAYSSVLRQITGKSDLQSWKEILSQM